MKARERYAVERQPEVGRQPGLYAILDKTTGELVTDDGVLLLFTMKHSADAWIGARAYMEQFVTVGFEQ